MRSAPRFWNKVLRYSQRLVIMAVLVYVGLGVVLFLFQKAYIYYPDKTAFEECNAFSQGEQVRQGSMRGYFVRQSPERVVVFYHGNAGRACDRSYLKESLGGSGTSMLFVEYSGYAEDATSPSMMKILENVSDTIIYLEEQSFSEIAVVGESIGAGPASYHAKHQEVDQVILLAGYNNLASVAFSHYPVYPMELLVRDNYTPDAWLSDYMGRVDMIVAEHDQIIAQDLSRKLFEGIPTQEKYFHVIENTDHNSMYGEEMFYTLLRNSLSER